MENRDTISLPLISITRIKKMCNIFVIQFYLCYAIKKLKKKISNPFRIHKICSLSAITLTLTPLVILVCFV